MKWEILKGSEKDFDGAPEWATMLLLHIGGRFAFSEAVSKGSRRTDLYDVGVDAEITSPAHFQIIAERRPITEPDVSQQVTNEWSGDRLPPAGVE